MRYRIYVSIDASALFLQAQSFAEPSDWNVDEDGEWDPPASSIHCVARYYQFTTKTGKHVTLGLWPANALCALNRENSVARDSFDVSLPEPLAQVIGGAMLGSQDRDVRLPRLSVEPDGKAPDWWRDCEHVGLVTLPDGEWDLGETDNNIG